MRTGAGRVYSNALTAQRRLFANRETYIKAVTLLL